MIRTTCNLSSACLAVLLAACLALTGCKQNHIETSSSGLTQAPNEVEQAKSYSELCSTTDIPDFKGEHIEVQNLFKTDLREFKRANNMTPKFGGRIYPSLSDFNGDGIEDYYLTIPGYNYSSFRKDYTELFIVMGGLETPEKVIPILSKKALHRRLFSGLDQKTLQQWALQSVKNKNTEIITAKVIPVKFKSNVYLRIEAQLDTADNRSYRSAYESAPDWITYAIFDQNLNIQPICGSPSDGL